jgi:hypothetical protein
MDRYPFGLLQEMAAVLRDEERARRIADAKSQAKRQARRR